MFGFFKNAIFSCIGMSEDINEAAEPETTTSSDSETESETEIPTEPKRVIPADIVNPAEVIPAKDKIKRPFKELPEEILQLIISWLNFSVLSKFRLVSKEWNNYILGLWIDHLKNALVFKQLVALNKKEPTLDKWLSWLVMRDKININNAWFISQFLQIPFKERSIEKLLQAPFLNLSNRNAIKQIVSYIEEQLQSPFRDIICSDFGILTISFDSYLLPNLQDYYKKPFILMNLMQHLLSEKTSTHLYQGLLTAKDIIQRPELVNYLAKNGYRLLADKIMQPHHLSLPDETLQCLVSDEGFFLLTSKLLTIEQIVTHTNLFKHYFSTKNGLQLLSKHLLTVEQAIAIASFNPDDMLPKSKLSRLELLTSDNGVMALTKQLFTVEDIMHYGSGVLEELISDKGLAALSKGLITVGKHIPSQQAYTYFFNLSKAESQESPGFRFG